MVASPSGAAYVEKLLIQSRPPLEYLKPFEKHKYRPIEGVIDSVRNYLGLFENGPPPERVKEETPQEKKGKAWKEKVLGNRRKTKEEIKSWSPKNNPNATGDPYKTLFVCRLSKDTSAKRLKKIFEEYGPIKKLVLIHDTKTGKAKHYAFIEYENINDFKGSLIKFFNF